MTNTSLDVDYFRYLTQERIQRSKITCTIAILFFLFGGGILDYLVYQDDYQNIFLIRIVTTLVLIGIYFSYKRFGKPESVSLYIEILWPIIINASICFMIYELDGSMSPYHAGLNATILGAMLLFLLSFRGTLLIVGVTVALYSLAIYPTIDNIQQAMLINNYYFLLLTGAVASVASFVNEKQRYTEYSLRHELKQRNQQLAELDRVKTDFFANISHELRTPLTLILSPVEDLLRSDQPFDFKVHKLLTTARDNGYRLLKLVNDILSIVRLDESDRELDCNPVDIQPLLRSIATSMQHLADKQKIRLHVSSNFTPAVINGNVNALEKIFINIINNAIKFTPENGEIRINNEVDAEGVNITISDTGIGISEKDLPNIFDRFQQADSSATRKYQGTGLGLALVRELTLALNGRINVESQLNKGTTFRLFFPIVNQEQDIKDHAIVGTPRTDYVEHSLEKNSLEKLHQQADLTLQLNRPDAITLEPAQQKFTDKDNADLRENLLIVEDEPDLRTYLVNTLSNDYRVMSAADGQAGLELVKKHKPDLVLLDLMLPKINGLVLCEKIKNDDSLKFTKVVLLTARIDEESKITALKNGADDFLTKPFSTTELKTRLGNLSDSLKLEKELQIHNAELAEALANLKAAESKLIHSEKLNAIGSLAAGLLHEVNNPLNYTLTAAQILKRDPTVKDDEDMAEMVDDIIEGMDRIKVIVKDLHTFAYPDEVDKEQAFFIADAVRSALRFTASEKGATTIEIDVSDQLEVLGSISHIVQVLVNLITNASKAIHAKSDKEAGIIVISAKKMIASDTIDDDGDDDGIDGKSPDQENAIQGKGKPRVLVSVRDNGIGIEQETLSRIFEPFYTTRDVGEGLGMGLSICHTIIENHGGSIDVKSKVENKENNSSNTETSFTEFSFDLAAAHV